MNSVFISDKGKLVIEETDSFECMYYIYTEKWQDRCHPLGWLCELPHHP